MTAELNISDILLKKMELVREGEMSAMELKIIVKNIEDALKEIKTELDESVVFEMNGDKKADLNGYSFVYKTGRANYSYNHIPEWNAKKAELKAIQDRAKSALKAQMNGHALLDEDEIVEPANLSRSKDYVEVKWIG